MKKNEGIRARRGITKDFERRLMAQRRRMTLSVIKGTKRRPERDTSHTFAGFMAIETYDNARSAATMSISTLDDIPKNVAFFFLLSFFLAFGI